MAAQSVVDSWSFHHGLYAAIEPRSALRFAFDAERHKIGKQLLRIRNESGSDHITYKIKTTGPEKFKVHPCTGVIAFGGAEAQVEIKPNLSLAPDVALFNKERFLVCTMPIAEIPSTQEELLAIWANNDAVADADTHILAVAIDPLNTGPHAQDVPMDTSVPERFSTRREERLREDNQLLGIMDIGGGGGDDSSNRASHTTPLSVGEYDAASAAGYGSLPAEPLISRSPSPSAAFYSRPYEDNAPACARTMPASRCIETHVDYPDPDAWPVSCSRSLGAILTIVLSVVAWWAVHSVTPEPPTTVEWIMRKIGIRWY